MAASLSPTMKEKRECFSLSPEHDEKNSKGPSGEVDICPLI